MHRRSIHEPSLLTGEFSLGAVLGNTELLCKPPFLEILSRILEKYFSINFSGLQRIFAGHKKKDPEAIQVFVQRE